LEYVDKYHNWYCESCAIYREPEVEETYIRKGFNYESPLFGTRKNKQAVIIILLAFILIIIPVYLSLLPNFNDDQKMEPQDDWRDWSEHYYVFIESGYTNENNTSDVEFDLYEEYTTSLNLNLLWTDEPSSYFQGTNEPDTFKLTIISPTDETIQESDFNISGLITITVNLNPDEYLYTDNYLGTWRILVEAGNCGDDASRFGMRTTPDTGNDWTLDISYQYYVKEDLD
jgi:hypothetical protein